MTSIFFPVYGGRTSNPQVNARSIYQVQMARAGIERLQTQLSTGQRLLTPSDEPDAAVRILQLQREQEYRTQAIGNLNSAQSFLNTTESTLSSIQDQINEMRGLTVSASTNLNSDLEKAGLLSQIDQTLTALVGKANTRFQDRFLFSGALSSQATVKLSGTSVEFQGDEQEMLAISDLGQVVPHNVPGQRALGLMSASVLSTADFAPAAVQGTLLSDLNGGRGVSEGAIEFTDGNDKVSIDLAQAATVGDVLSLINGKVQLSGRDIEVNLLANGTLRVQYSDGQAGIVRISNVGAGRAASDLGIETSLPIPTLPIISPSLDPILKLNTRLTQFNDGAGLDKSEGFRITQGERTYTILLSNAETIEDLFNQVRRSGASIVPEITPDGRNIRFRSTQSGSDFSIGENGGLLATRLGIRTLISSTRLDQLNHGRGVNLSNGSTISIRKNNGTQFSVSLEGSITIQDVLDRVNNHVSNQDATTKITASLNNIGNGITLSSVLAPPGTPNPEPIAVSSFIGAEAAWDLGLIPPGQSIAVGSFTATDSQLVGKDNNPQEVRGIFNSILRFRNAVQKGDLGQISRASQLFEEDLERLSSSRGSLGVSLQQIDDLTRTHEDRNLDLVARESQLKDADIAATITELTGRQVAYQASLQLLANSNRMNLFDYL